MTVEMRRLEQIKPYQKNARKIPQGAIDKVALSLKEYGWRQPIVVDVDGVIIVGHVRRLAALQLGWAEAPVHVAEHLSAAQVRAYRLMDNRSHEETSWDLGLLAPELTDLNAISFDLSLTGFSVGELDTFLASPVNDDAANDTPPVPEIPVSRLGDLWILGSHRVLCGDATSREAVKLLLEDRQPKLMVADAPYGIQLDSTWRDRAGLNGCENGTKQRTEGHVHTSMSGDTRADWSEAFALVPSLEAVYVWHASIYTREVLDGLLRIGFLYPQQLIWNKGRVVLTRTHYWYQHEPFWYLRVKNAPWYGKPGENSTVWDASSPKFFLGSAEDKADHPTQKPVDLMRRPILNHTRRGELVYDPFLGSGTTVVAAELTGRSCCGLEIDPKYLDVIILRWQKLSGKQATLGGRCFEEVRAERLGSPGGTA